YVLAVASSIHLCRSRAAAAPRQPARASSRGAASRHLIVDASLQAPSSVRLVARLLAFSANPAGPRCHWPTAAAVRPAAPAGGVPADGPLQFAFAGPPTPLLCLLIVRVPAHVLPAFGQVRSSQAQGIRLDRLTPAARFLVFSTPAGAAAFLA